jgi:hypothetical protein
MWSEITIFTETLRGLFFCLCIVTLKSKET